MNRRRGRKRFKELISIMITITITPTTITITLKLTTTTYLDESDKPETLTP